MSSFVEKLLQNELPVDGFKPYVTRRDLLRDEKDKITAPNFLRPTIRGFFSQNWKHGNSLTQGDRGFSLELSDRIKIGKCYLRPQFILQNGTTALYRASLGVNLGTYGDLEFTQQAKNANVHDQFEVTHSSSVNGLNTRASLSFEGPQLLPVVRLSSLYNMTMEVFDRRTKKLDKRTTIYGQDASFSMVPFKQLNYSLYYQAKAPNFDLIAAYLRKETCDKLYSNDIVAGMKYTTLDNKKVLAKFSYNLEDKQPHMDLMVRNNHNDKRIKTFHKISSDLKVGSGFTLSMHRLKLNGLVQVNLLNNNLGSQPFSLSLRVETNGHEKRNGQKKGQLF